MDKRMEKVAVRTTDGGDILIIQESDTAEDAIVCVSTDQVDVLVSWLNEAREEIRRRSAGRLHSVPSN